MLTTMVSGIRGEESTGRPVSAPPSAQQEPIAVSPMFPRREAGSASLSFGQERWWFLHQINPDDTSGNITRGQRIKGELKPDLLQRSLRTLVNRHEALRTTFATKQLHAGFDSKPVQLVAETSVIELSIVDLSLHSPVERELRTRELRCEVGQHPFDLSMGPLLRAVLVKLGEHEHVLLLTLHRIISDESSMEILLEELWQTYSDCEQGNIHELTPLPIQYADYAFWERSELNGEALRRLGEHWQAKLRATPAILEMPTDRPRPAVQSWHGSSLAVILKEQVTDGLKALSDIEGTTLETTLLAAFQVLLFRYSGQTDIVVGSTIVNREFAGAEKIIGPLSNTLVLRTRLGGDLSFRELLGEVKCVAHEAHAHRAIPFERLLEELQLERSLSHAPLFQARFNLKSKSADRISVPNLGIEEYQFDNVLSRLDLTLEVIECADRLNCRFEYNIDLFDRQTIASMASNFETLAQGLIDNPDLRISELPLLSPGARRQLLVEWNDTKEAYQSSGLQDLFDSAVRRAPDKIALICEDQRLNYGQLDQRANQVARFLRQRGIGPETIVGICMTRSLEMVVALLGIVKAGAAYLPLDPTYPQDRLSFMLRDAAVSLVLTHRGLLPSLSPTISSLFVDINADEIGREPASTVSNYTSAANLVYVIYTSGSTGNPKGVMITHEGLGNYLKWSRQHYLSTTSAGSLVHSPLAFDLTVTSLLVPLVQGQTVTLLPKEETLEELCGTLRKTAVCGLLKITPAHLEGLGYLMSPEEVKDKVATLVIGGEALRAESLSLWRSGSVTRIINEYGPTETVVGCCTYEMQAADPSNGSVPMGRPIANTQLYVLDERFELVPCGVIGELYIGGAGLVRGYLGRPELTAERFLPDPFSGNPGQRLYRTGDFVRYRFDGNIVFIGRADGQVKVRGYRIELGEIEKLIAEYPGIKQVVVLVQESEGGKRLVAYLTTDDPEALSIDALQSFLNRKLPQYMVPSSIAIIESFPLTINGKIDRQKLALQKSSQPDLLKGFVAARDQLEEQLVNVWKKVLGISSVGVTDNFFELGGHSILAARLFAQIENRFGRSVPLAALFQAPTIESLAQLLRESRPSGSWSSLVAIQPVGSKPPLFCVHPAGANVLVFRPMSRHLGKHQPLYALQAQGLDGSKQPYTRVEQMAAHYIEEIRTVQAAGPYFLLGASFGGLVAFEMALQLLRRGQRVALLAMLNTNCPVYSLPHRVRCHLGHMRQFGLRQYLRGTSQALSRRIGRAVVSSASLKPLNRELQDAISTRVAGDDPLVRTILAIVEASDNYLPVREVYPGKITLFWARDSESDFEDNRMAWRKLAAGGLDIHVIPGDHTSIREEPNVGTLVDHLRDCLAHAQAQSQF